MTTEGTMAPRFLSEFMDTTHTYITPPSRINIKSKKIFAHRPVMKVAPEANLATEAPVMILKPFFLIGDLEINNTSSTANRTLVKPKNSSKAKVAGFLTRQSKTKELTYDRRPTSALLTKSTPAFAAPKPTLRTASIHPIDLAARFGLRLRNIPTFTTFKRYLTERKSVISALRPLSRLHLLLEFITP
jgi:hypothetical protein